MFEFPLTLALDEQLIIVIIFVAIGLISSVVNKIMRSKADDEDQPTEEGGTRQSTTERLQQLAEQRRRQLQELARQRQGGTGTQQPSQRPSPAQAVAPAAPAQPARPQPSRTQQPARPATPRPQQQRPTSRPAVPVAQPARDAQADDERRARLRRAQAAARRQSQDTDETRPTSRKADSTQREALSTRKPEDTGKVDERSIAQDLGRHRTTTDSVAPAARESRVSILIGQLAGLSRSDLQKAVILKEILDQPVGVRDGVGGWSG